MAAAEAAEAAAFAARVAAQEASYWAVDEGDNWWPAHAESLKHLVDPAGRLSSLPAEPEGRPVATARKATRKAKPKSTGDETAAAEAEAAAQAELAAAAATARRAERRARHGDAAAHARAAQAPPRAAVGGVESFADWKVARTPAKPRRSQDSEAKAELAMMPSLRKAARARGVIA